MHGTELEIGIQKRQFRRKVRCMAGWSADAVELHRWRPTSFNALARDHQRHWAVVGAVVRRGAEKQPFDSSLVVTANRTGFLIVNA